VAYDVKRLNSIRQGEADISDRDAVVEIVAGTVETMVTAHRKTSAALENRYRNQLRALHEVMQRLNVEADLPASLRTWAATQSANVPPWMIRESAEDIFDHLLDGINENQDGAIDVPNSVSMATSDRESEAVIGPQHRMLEVMYETFALTGQWPLFQYVNAQLWEELQLEPRDVYLDLAERSLVNPAITRSHHFELRENIPVGVRLREAILERVEALFARHAPKPHAPSGVVTEAIVGAVWGLVYDRVARGESDRLGELTKHASFIALAPVLGAEEAVERILAGPGKPALKD
jgi:hypothetical protein